MIDMSLEYIEKKKKKQKKKLLLRKWKVWVNQRHEKVGYKLLQVTDKFKKKVLYQVWAEQHECTDKVPLKRSNLNGILLTKQSKWPIWYV